MKPLYALLTDFGLADPYVGQLKGMLMRQTPDCRIVDISHGIEPFCIEQAAFFLEISRQWFPPSTVFIAVVDPGVGSDRKVVCLEMDDCFFLAPDNGLLTLLLESPSDKLAFDLTRPCNFQQPMIRSQTFHARDLFAPLAGYLAQGDSPELLGPSLDIDSLVLHDWARPKKTNGSYTFRVLHVDRFGNVILNAPNAPWYARLGGLPGLSVQNATDKEQAKALLFPVPSYSHLADSGRIGLIQGSQGYLELGANMASAAKILGLKVGDDLCLTSRNSSHEH